MYRRARALTVAAVVSMALSSLALSGCVGGELQSDGQAGDEAAVKAKTPPPTVVVNLFDAGMVYKHVMGSNGQYTLQQLTSSDLLSCVPNTVAGGDLPMAWVPNFLPQVGTKYVLPIKEDSTCAGRGLYSLFEGNGSGINVKGVDITLEDMTTGQAYSLTKPDSCVWSAKHVETSGFYSMLNPTNAQLSIVATTAPASDGYLELADVADRNALAFDCYYASNWPWPY